VKVNVKDSVLLCIPNCQNLCSCSYRLQIIADKLHAYLQHHLSLVNWAEQSLVNGFYEDDAAHTIGNILSQLRLTDVKAFGLE